MGRIHIETYIWLLQISAMLVIGLIITINLFSPSWPRQGDPYKPNTLTHFIYGPWVCENPQYIDAYTPITNEREWNSCLQTPPFYVWYDHRQSFASSLGKNSIFVALFGLSLSSLCIVYQLAAALMRYSKCLQPPMFTMITFILSIFTGLVSATYLLLAAAAASAG